MRQPLPRAFAADTPALANARKNTFWGGGLMTDSLDMLGPAIRTLRKGRGLTQEQLAKAVGASRQAVGRWEDGGVLPDLRHACYLAQVLGVGLDELVFQGEGWAASGTTPAREDILGVTAVEDDGRLALSKAAARHMDLRPGDKLVITPWGPTGVAMQELEAFLRVSEQ